MADLDTGSSVWLTGFWSFAPEEEGFLGFTDEHDRDRLFQRIGERQLVCIYGASSPETDRRNVHQLLGVIEVERLRIDSWEKMSEAAKKRNIKSGHQEKWRHAMPVRRAWRTKHTLDVKQVFPRSYDPTGGRYIARFGTGLVPDEARWLLEKVPFSQTEVFGESSISDQTAVQQPASISSFLKPSRGIFGSFGDRSFQVHDKTHLLYLAHFPSSPELLAGRPLVNGTGLVKIGISGNINNRLKALNLSFPQTTKVKWKMCRTAKFQDRASAAEAEAAFKMRAIERFGGDASLGKEFFILNLKKADELFNELSPATGLDLRAKSLR